MPDKFPRLDYFPVIGQDGRLIEVRCSSSNLYDRITEHVGSPFDGCVLGRDPETGVFVDAFVRDNGLFDGSLPNPVFTSMGVPICGPVMLLGGADARGNSLPPFDIPLVRAMINHAKTITAALVMIEANRQAPFTIVSWGSVSEEVGDANG